MGGEGIGAVVTPDVADAHCGDAFALRHCVLALQDDHVTAVALAPVEIAPGRGAVFGGRHDFEKIAADREQRVLKAKLGHAGILVADLQTQHRTDFLDGRFEFLCDEDKLTQSHDWFPIPLPAGDVSTGI